MIMKLIVHGAINQMKLNNKNISKQKKNKYN